MIRLQWLSLLSLLFAVGPLLAQEDDEVPAPKFRTVPWAVWGSVGTNFDSYSLTLAARRGPFGVGFGYRRDTKIDFPAYSTSAAPAGAAERSFALTKVGVDFYAAYPFAEGISGYGTIGGYTTINTVLDSAGGQWYRSEKSPDWSGADVEYGAGVEISPLDWLIAGLGYHSARGFNIHVGYTW